jgi:predicted phosphodiesterase
MAERVRLGLLSDLHYELEPPAARSAINRYEQEEVPGRLAAARELFAEARVDAIVLLGDVTELGDQGALDAAFEPLRGASAPIGVVPGNHDRRAHGPVFERAAKRAGITMLNRQTLRVGRLTIAGIDVEPVEPGLPLYEAGSVPHLEGDDSLVVLASHFPVLSQAQLLAAAGLPYYGDLLDRPDVATALVGSTTPIVIVNGHLHARCTATHRSLLQLTVGALVEPPFDCTVIEVSLGAEVHVQRRAVRLGAPALVNPVFAADEEQWRLDGERWMPVAA